MEVISENVKYYSSDYNIDLDSLIYSERTGNILFNGNNIVTDHLKKTVRFYYPDNHVFTTTDVTGLRVWDSYKGKLAYSYEKEELAEHAYSDSGIVAAAGLYTINFYDLRSRYCIHTVSVSNVTQLEWVGLYLYAYSADKLIIYDYGLHEKIAEINNCNGFAIGGKNVFVLKRKDILVFNSADSANIIQADTINKKTKYNKIMSVKGQEYILGITNESLVTESFEKVENLNILDKIKDVGVLYVRGTKKILFMNDKIYQSLDDG